MNITEEAVWKRLAEWDHSEVVRALKTRGEEIREELRRELADQLASAWEERMRGDDEPVSPAHVTRWLRAQAGPATDEEKARIVREVTERDARILLEAKNEALEEAAKKAEEMGRGWGILRSMKMTEHANAAKKVAEAIRSMKETP